MKKLSEILRGAYAHLWDGESDYNKYIICPGICAAVHKTAEVGTQAARDFIEHELDTLCKELSISPVAYYTGIFKQLGVPDKLADDPTWRQLRRREWLTMLISKLEREGR
jgi:hypothetical protein